MVSALAVLAGVIITAGAAYLTERGRTAAAAAEHAREEAKDRRRDGVVHAEEALKVLTEVRETMDSHRSRDDFPFTAEMRRRLSDAGSLIPDREVREALQGAVAGIWNAHIIANYGPEMMGTSVKQLQRQSAHYAVEAVTAYIRGDDVESSTYAWLTAVAGEAEAAFDELDRNSPF